MIVEACKTKLETVGVVVGELRCLVIYFLLVDLLYTSSNVQL